MNLGTNTEHQEWGKKHLNSAFESALLNDKKFKVIVPIHYMTMKLHSFHSQSNPR